MRQFIMPAQPSQGVDAGVTESARLAAAPILVAVDFSPDSEMALRWACSYAEKLGAPIEVLHVVHDPAESPGKYKADDGDALAPMTETAEQKLAAFIAELESQHPELNQLKTANPRCIRGLPAGTILDMADKRGAQLIVLGSRGRSGLARVLLGSTSEQVTRRAAVPVTIVKAKGR